MARNSEKAQSMLHRFLNSSNTTSLPSASVRRPKAPSTVSALPTAEKFRSQILREISRKLTRISDESCSDFQIRDLNDELNKLMKEKWSWERRIKELGGPNYGRGPGAGGVMFDEQGNMVGDAAGGGGGKGYRYFGRAKELPGVKEMFERAAKKRVRETEAVEGGKEVRQHVERRNLDARYFGWGDEEKERALVKAEKRKEREAEERFKGRVSEEEDAEWVPLPGDQGDGLSWRLPTLEEVQVELMDRRRKTLLENLG